MSRDSLVSASAAVDAAERATLGVLVASPSRPDGFVTEFANARARVLLGAVPARIPDDLPLPEEARSALREWLVHGTDATFTLDAVAVHASRDAQAVRLVASRAGVEGHGAVVLFVSETALRRAELALAESEARFRRLLDAAPDAVALGTRERFVYANPALVRLLGYQDMGEVVGRPLREHLLGDDRAVAREIAKALLEGGPPRPFYNIRARRKDGSVVETVMRALTIEWGGERVMLALVRDLTERRRVQAQLIRADRLASMGTLAAGVAHEINNPLAYLMLNIQFLIRELPRFDGNEARRAVLLERLAEAEHGARRVSTIVGDLRSFAHPEEVERGSVSVPKAIRAAVKVASTELRRRARVVETYDPVRPVEGSTARLEQVFVNLLINAAQAVPEGNADGNEVAISAREMGSNVVVEVRDTGVGISRETLGRVFDPFFTTKPRGVGTGLGLPISRGIVRAMGGDISIESTVGVGTTVRVSLPAIAAEDVLSSPAAAPATWAPAEARARRGRLLVVDDEPLVADMLKRTLSEIHDVTVATDAQTALEKMLSGDEFDLVFCDLLMPRMSGMDLYERLRAERPGVEDKIVFMTGGAFTDRAAQFLATVPNPKLTKPFDLRVLEEIVARAIRTPE